MLTRRQSASQLVLGNGGEVQRYSPDLSPDSDPQSAEQSYQRSSECVRADSLKTISPQSHLSNKVVRTELKDYTLNKEKALSKKLLGCAKDDIKIEMKQNKNLVLELSTSAYELMKQTINDFLNYITNDTQLQLAFDVEKVLDEDGVHVETRY